jgi:prevent-host-death family protein
MATRIASRGRNAGGRSIADLPAWKLEDAKARFSEVVRRARSEGPQRVTCRGQEAVVVIATEELARLLAPRRTGADLIRFLQATGLGDLDIERQDDRGRDIEF